MLDLISEELEICALSSRELSRGTSWRECCGNCNEQLIARQDHISSDSRSAIGFFVDWVGGDLLI